MIKQAAKRQQELKDPQLRDDLAAARAVLKKHSTMLLTASKVYVRHPELDLAKVNRDYVLKQVCEAVNTISDVAQGKASAPVEMYSGAGELAAALDDFDVSFVVILTNIHYHHRFQILNSIYRKASIWILSHIMTQ